MQLKSYKELIVWQKSIQLVKVIYFVTKQFPKTEMYSLASQMQRSAISIPSNIYCRGGGPETTSSNSPDFSQFLTLRLPN